MELADGSVVVPARLAGAVRRILVRDLAQHVRADGGQPTADVRQLVYAFARSEHRYDVDQADSSATGTPDARPPIVEISAHDAASLLGCSVEYVRRLCQSGRVSARRAGRRAWLIDRASLDAYRYRTEEP